MEKERHEVQFFECDCHDLEHLIKFELWIDKNDADLYLSVFLNQHRNFFKRIWIAIKYIFGYKCRYGHWDNWSLAIEDAERLKNLIEKFIYAEEED